MYGFIIIAREHMQGCPFSVTLEFKDFKGLFKDLSTTTMHIPKIFPVHC